MENNSKKKKEMRELLESKLRGLRLRYKTNKAHGFGSAKDIKGKQKNISSLYKKFK